MRDRRRSGGYAPRAGCPRSTQASGACRCPPTQPCRSSSFVCSLVAMIACQQRQRTRAHVAYANTDGREQKPLGGREGHRLPLIHPFAVPRDCDALLLRAHRAHTDVGLRGGGALTSRTPPCSFRCDSPRAPAATRGPPPAARHMPGLRPWPPRWPPRRPPPWTAGSCCAPVRHMRWGRREWSIVHRFRNGSRRGPLSACHKK